MSHALKGQSIFAGYLFAIGATAIWSGNLILARGLNDSIPPISLAFYRWVVAVIFFAPFAIKTFMQEWPIIKKHIVYFSVTSFLGITTFNTLIYFAGHTAYSGESVHPFRSIPSTCSRAFRPVFWI
ncbi:MAG: EamA family transporter [Desulfobacula sp.]|nr:EamA family transporter [Desulfobacula sp.]